MCKQMTDIKLLLLDRNTWNYLTVCKQMIKIKKNYLYSIEKLKNILLYAKKM